MEEIKTDDIPTSRPGSIPAKGGTPPRPTFKAPKIGLTSPPPPMRPPMITPSIGLTSQPQPMIPPVPIQEPTKALVSRYPPKNKTIIRSPVGEKATGKTTPVYANNENLIKKLASIEKALSKVDENDEENEWSDYEEPKGKRMKLRDKPESKSYTADHKDYLISKNKKIVADASAQIRALVKGNSARKKVAIMKEREKDIYKGTSDYFDDILDSVIDATKRKRMN